jgi:Skp family chaperone for outer membrane proteins
MSNTLRLLAGLVIASVAGQALAQTPTTAPALGGNAIPGVCLLSRQALFVNAKVGVAATARLQQLAKAAQDEIAADQQPVDADVKAFQAEAGKLTPAQRQQREQALSPRVQAVQAKAQQRSREIEATREKAMAQIAADAQPVLAKVYKAKGCGLLVDRNSVLGGNMTNDLTPDVVKGLDATITTINFNREILPAGAQTAAR